MSKVEVTDDDIRERRDEYKQALKKETQASATVREMWRKLVAMLDELLDRRWSDRQAQRASTEECPNCRDNSCYRHKTGSQGQPL